MTSPIKVQNRVSQEDSLSPFLFNLIANTMINTIKSKKVDGMSYVYNGAFSPNHWFQFADDTAIVNSVNLDRSNYSRR